MLIGVISDTHDRLSKIEGALDIFARCGVQALIHPGDVIAPFAARCLLRYPGPIYVTYGNNDGERQGLRQVLPQIQDGPLIVTMAGRIVLMHHFIEWCTPEDVQQADIIITGHTHQVDCREHDGKLFLNPGECCGWVTKKCTVAILNTDGPSAEIVSF